MEIGAMTSASFATQQTQSVIQARSESLPSERPREPAASPSRETQAPPPPREERNVEGAQQAQRPEPPKPVVNERGQKTGTIINTTA